MHHGSSCVGSSGCLKVLAIDSMLWGRGRGRKNRILGFRISPTSLARSHRKRFFYNFYSSCFACSSSLLRFVEHGLWSHPNLCSSATSSTILQILPANSAHDYRLSSCVSSPEYASSQTPRPSLSRCSESCPRLVQEEIIICFRKFANE